MTLGFTHLQFEAMLTASRKSASHYDFALVALLGMRIFEAVGADIGDLGEEHGHRVLRVCGKGGARMDRHVATRRLRRLAQQAGVGITRPHPHIMGHIRDDHA